IALRRADARMSEQELHLMELEAAFADPGRRTRVPAQMGMHVVQPRLQRVTLDHLPQVAITYRDTGKGREEVLPARAPRSPRREVLTAGGAPVEGGWDAVERRLAAEEKKKRT